MSYQKSKEPGKLPSTPSKSPGKQVDAESMFSATLVYDEEAPTVPGADGLSVTISEARPRSEAPTLLELRGDESSQKIYRNPNNVDEDDSDSLALVNGSVTAPPPNRGFSNNLIQSRSPKSKGTATVIDNDAFDEEDAPVFVEKLGSAKRPNGGDLNETKDFKATASRKADSVQKNTSGCCCKFFVVSFLFLVVLLVLGLVLLRKDGGFGKALSSGTNSPTLSPTIFPTNSPTLSPTQSPLSPTVSPTHSPTKSPTKFPTKNPTDFPTKSPTTFPTFSPTTTLDTITSICSGSSERTRTSMCLTSTSWVRCEKDGTVVMSADDFVRVCDQGDVCPCDTLQRVGISDPCVRSTDVLSSSLTCAVDSRT